MPPDYQRGFFIMQKYRKQIFIGLLLALGIYILLLVVADSQGQLETDGIVRQIQSFPWYLIPLVIACQLGVIAFRFAEWHYYLGVIDARDKISLADSLIIFVATFTMVVSPGKAAEIVKAVLLKTKTGVPVARSAPIVIAERVVDGLAVILIMATTLLLAGDALNLGTYNGIDYGTLSRTIIYSSLALITAGLIVIQIQPLAYFFLNLLPKIPLIRRLHQPLIDFYESSREIFSLRHVLPMTVVGVGVYMSSIAGFMVILTGLGLPFSWNLFLQATFIVGVSSAVGALSFVPNGAGVTEISTTGMLLALVSPLYVIVTPGFAAAAALLQGFFHKWFRVLVGLLVALIFQNRLFSDDFEAALREYDEQQTGQSQKNTQTQQQKQTAISSNG
jgi:uncharacterized protein (TIRG00374 family)